MDYLLLCGVCDHAVCLHGDEGCSGPRMSLCGCRLARGEAVEAAISAAATAPWRAPEPVAGA